MGVLMRVLKEWVTWLSFIKTRYQCIYQYSWALEIPYSNVCNRNEPGNFPITNINLNLLINNSHDPSMYTLSMYIIQVKPLAGQKYTKNFIEKTPGLRVRTCWIALTWHSGIKTKFQTIYIMISKIIWKEEMLHFIGEINQKLCKKSIFAWYLNHYNFPTFLTLLGIWFTIINDLVYNH